MTAGNGGVAALARRGPAKLYVVMTSMSKCGGNIGGLRRGSWRRWPKAVGVYWRRRRVWLSLSMRNVATWPCSISSIINGCHLWRRRRRHRMTLLFFPGSWRISQQ